MKDFLAQSKCDVCGRTGIAGVASSCLGAISFAFCGECLTNRAEPEFMLAFTYDMCDGNVAEWVEYVQTWHEGRYKTWDEWVQYRLAHPEEYPPLEAPEPRDIDETFDEEFDFEEAKEHDDVGGLQGSDKQVS